MSDTLQLSAETRDRVGKGASRALRRDGRVPAVIYGNNQEPQSIHLSSRELVKQLMTGHFMNSVIQLSVGGGTVRTLAKDVAFHPVTDLPVHVDFLRIARNATVTVAVPVVFTGEESSPGLQRGGVLNVVRHEVELTVEASNIPTELSVDVSGLDVGDTVHISAVALPNGAEPATQDRDFTIATLVAPSALKAEEQEIAAAEAEAAEAASAEHAAEVEATEGGDATEPTAEGEAAGDTNA